MENASKALIMAAGVLIGVLILSLAVYLFVSFGTSSAQVHKQNEENQLNEFNTQFTSYEGREDITIYDVITVKNLADENNRHYELESSTDSNFYITVKLENSVNSVNSVINNNNEKKLIEGNSGENGNLPTYNCKVTISPVTGRVKEIRFSRKK